MVDRAALEMQCTARYRGFESLPLRQLELSRQTSLKGKPDRPVLVPRRDENPGSVRPQAEQAIRQDWGEASQRSGANPSLSAS